jgi:hypothetical protein
LNFSKIREDIRKSRCTTSIKDTRGKLATGAVDTASINDTGGKVFHQIATGVNDTGGKFPAGVNNAGGNVPPAAIV